MLSALPTARAATSDEAALAAQIFDAINERRAANGVPALRFDASQAAGAQETANYNRIHVGEPGCEDACHRPEGNAHFEIVYWAEGSTSAQAATNFWMGSPPHRKNMLSAGATAAGVGVAINPETNRTWAVTWFNGGDTLPAPDAPGSTPTTAKVSTTPTTPKPATATTAAPSATTAAPTTASSTTSSTADPSTTTTSTTQPRTDDTLALRSTSNEEDGGNLLVRFMAVAGVLAAGLGVFVVAKKIRS